MHLKVLVSLIIVFPAALRPCVDIVVELISLMAPQPDTAVFRAGNETSLILFSVIYYRLLHCVHCTLVFELKQLPG